MGGFGSGRKFGADCTEDCRSIDIRRWQREGYLTPGQYLDWQWLRNGERVAAIGVKVESGQLRLIYSYHRNGDEWESLDYPVRLQTTACNYGGLRYWFTCPAVGCGRRVAVLYLGGKYFACRHCYRLAYKSQRETADDRASRRADKIRDKLGWHRGILNLPGGKPKGMHWKTYYRLFAKHNEHSDRALVGIAAKLGMLNDRLANIQSNM
ncbi:hypothetical protein [Methylomicrobium sp. Wu6]|uniref:hypothetical protein n=1 Tax=Methylomicrobium sp. Wu6 TaxID=3107928 RepID=UPI002DD62688|nr:hypothetical protein [Methylomicrobium sp. Wu6]MEC4747455.1 hypothetical protein [Methylomicrobium sp. Wu6]